MRIIVFGASGNSGLYLCHKLLGQGHSVVGISRRRPEIVHPHFESFVGDIRDSDIFSQVAGDYDLAVNFAGIQPSILPYSETENRAKAAREYVDINVLGTINVVEFVRKCGIPTYVYASTHREIENHWYEKTVLRDDLDVSINASGDHSIYAISKVSGRWAGEYCLEGSSTRYFSLRLPMMFQIPQEPNYLVGGQPRIMPFLKIIKDAISGKPLEVWGEPTLRRDYVHVENLVQMIRLCHESDLPGGLFNVGTGEGATTEEFVRAIGEEFSGVSKRVELIYRPEKLTYKRAVYDISRAEETLKYRPIMLKEMVAMLRRDFEAFDCKSKWGW